MQIYLLRHGIAEDSAPGRTDADRALTPEGKKKLKELLRAARGAGVSPSLMLTSPYRRAVETAQTAAEVLGYGSDPLRTNALLPMGSVEGVWDEVRVHKDESALLLAGHEPQMGRLLGFLLGVPALETDFKKGALARVDVTQFGTQPRGVLRWLFVPKLAG
jgi:phosphohistidine phosphatase